MRFPAALSFTEMRVSHPVFSNCLAAKWRVREYRHGARFVELEKTFKMLYLGSLYHLWFSRYVSVVHCALGGGRADELHVHFALGGGRTDKQELTQRCPTFDMSKESSKKALGAGTVVRYWHNYTEKALE